jgi:hypothetical protein
LVIVWCGTSPVFRHPLEVERWRVGGHSVPIPDGAPAWLRDRAVKTLRVFADDRVVPVYE